MNLYQPHLMTNLVRRNTTIINQGQDSRFQTRQPMDQAMIFLMRLTEIISTAILKHIASQTLRTPQLGTKTLRITAYTWHIPLQI